MTIQNPLTFIVETLEKKGFQAMLVGGCVRDLLMGLAEKDHDFATTATPDEVIKNFAGEPVKVIREQEVG